MITGGKPAASRISTITRQIAESSLRGERPRLPCGIEAKSLDLRADRSTSLHSATLDTSLRKTARTGTAYRQVSAGFRHLRGRRELAFRHDRRIASGLPPLAIREICPQKDSISGKAFTKSLRLGVARKNEAAHLASTRTSLFPLISH